VAVGYNHARNVGYNHEPSVKLNKSVENARVRSTTAYPLHMARGEKKTNKKKKLFFCARRKKTCVLLYPRNLTLVGF
jgi:hypothetical protein